jgi:NAD(P)-dependent dehydrogenase (short-subunit alcohol dehydrogenase family)
MKWRTLSMLQRVTGPKASPDLRGKTALIVGATSGIGEEIARAIAAAGAALVITGRDPQKLDRVARSLSSLTAQRVRTICFDLADLKSVAAAAQALRAELKAIHLLIANAGLLYMGNERRFTRDGFELTIGVNHLGNAAFILGMQDLIRAGAPSRVVVVASEAHRRAGADPFSDMMGERRFSGLHAYSRSKLANILFSRELARRMEPEGVTVYAAHPGVVDTPILDAFVRTRFARATMPLVRRFFLTPQQAAQGILRVAADPTQDAASGSYFELGRINRGSEQSNDVELARRLWDTTQQLLATNAQAQ